MANVWLRCKVSIFCIGYLCTSRNNYRTEIARYNMNCYYGFFLVCVGCDTSYIVSIHIQCQVSIYTLSLCRGHSWRVRLAKQETLTPPGHLVSPLVCRGPWMSTVVFYCWFHSDSASVLLYFTLRKHKQIKQFSGNRTSIFE